MTSKLRVDDKFPHVVLRQIGEEPNRNDERIGVMFSALDAALVVKSMNNMRNMPHYPYHCVVSENGAVWNDVDFNCPLSHWS